MAERWSEARKKALQTMWLRGDRLSEIANSLNLSKNAVAVMAVRDGLPRRGSAPCKIDAPEHSQKHSAEALCERLKSFWARAGYPAAEFWVYEAMRHNHQSIFGVRSNLVNGLPPEAVE